MTRWFLLIVLLGLGCGCRSPYNMYAPYGPQCVPPPATGTVGQPYYPQPYPQPAPYGQPSPYGTYPGYPTYPQYPYSTGAPQTLPAPTVSQQPTYSQSSYIPTQNGWSSTAAYNAPSSTVSPGSEPRPSGQFLSTNVAQNLRENDQLQWSSRGYVNGGAGYSRGLVADSTPTAISSTIGPGFSSPIRPSVVRSNQVATYDAPLSYQTPISYDNVLDPYATAADTTVSATYIDPYGGQSVGSLATTSGWSPRR